MHTDTRGLALTTADETAATLYNDTIDAYFDYRLATGNLIKQALEADSSFVMAHCFRGCLFLQFASNTFQPRARDHYDAAQAQRNSVTPREQQHIDALGAWVAGDLRRACGAWEAILVDHPHDLVALRLHHYNSFWMGRPAAMREQAARALAVWDESMPGYGNLLGMLAFALEECNQYTMSEDYGRKAVALDGNDLWAIHAVAHVLEMQGRLKEGAEWLDYPSEVWDDRNPFRGHLWWHRALYLLEQGNYDQALDLYDRSVQSGAGAFYLDRQNMVSMLARLEFQGVDVGDRWAELADEAENHIDDHPMAFTDTHTMFALGADGRWDKAEAMLASLRRFAATPDDYSAATMNPVTVPLCEGLLAYARGDDQTVIDKLLPIRGDLPIIGASHAQRDLFIQTLIESAIRSDQRQLADALLSERVTMKPHSAGNWRKYIDILAAGDDTQRLAAARSRAAELGF